MTQATQTIIALPNTMGMISGVSYIRMAQITNEGGGQRDISTGGYGTKRELYMFMRGMVA